MSAPESEKSSAAVKQVTLTEDQKADLKEAFALFDADGDGKITAKELGSVLKAMGQNPSETELNDMISEVDIDGNGTIEYAEFQELMTSSKHVQDVSSEDEMKEAFAMFDQNKDGFISLEELHHLMSTLGEKLTAAEAQDMLREADQDGDGRINYAEFRIMMQNC